MSTLVDSRTLAGSLDCLQLCEYTYIDVRYINGYGMSQGKLTTTDGIINNSWCYKDI